MNATIPSIRNDGVYYRRQDYAGLWRRLLVSTVDGVVALAGLLGLMLIGFTIMPTIGAPVAFVTWFVLCYFYFVVCKRSHARTLGYRLGRVRIVDIHGDSPSSWSVTFRLLLTLMGAYSSLFGLFDLLWITADDDRQALRDKITHTYVVRVSAEPAGRGPIIYDVYQLMAWSLLLPHVRRNG